MAHTDGTFRSSDVVTSDANGCDIGGSTTTVTRIRSKKVAYVRLIIIETDADDNSDNPYEAVASAPKDNLHTG